MMRSVLGPGTVITISGKWLRSEGSYLKESDRKIKNGVGYRYVRQFSVVGSDILRHSVLRCGVKEMVLY